MKPHGKSLRRGRASEPCRIYLCTTVVRERFAVFADFRTGRIVVDVLRWQDEQRRTRTIAFVIMPDHLHWLFELRGELSLSTVVQSMKKRSARVVNARLCRRGSLWQPGFHDRAVRREEDLRSIARYVVSNPVRAGLVRSVRDYPLWDAMWLV